MVLKSRNSKDGVPYTVMECFAGIGAQHMALHTSGKTGPRIPYEIVGTAEIDPRSIAAYNAIHAGDGGYTPDRNIGDVTKHHLPHCDVLTYSFPCQGLSKANTGKKKGLTDPESHSSVLWALEDEIRRTRPKWLVMENVTQIHNRNYMPDFQRWIDVLSEMGYTSKWGDLRVSDFGVPQDRDRCFMISHLGPGCPDLPVGDSQAPRLLDFIDDDPSLLVDYEIPYAMLCDLMHGG